jgi:hypothetical protein
MADLRVDIAAEFVGKKAFKEADMAAVRLDKTIKKLARTFGVTLGAGAIVAYSKAAVKAFAADEAAANRLATAVDNLGLSFSKVQVATFISDLEKTASIADDVLRPAFQSLLNITGSLTKSQELLNNAIQISRASGVDLATVTNDLGKGYVGITRGLIKYNTGLTRAELQTKGFNEILGIMLAKSAGAAQEYLTTTSFKMDTLALASENAKETIGKGLVDAFARIGGGTEAADAAKAIDNIAKAVNGVTLVLGTAIGLVNKFRQGYTNFLMDPLGTGFGAGGASTGRSASPAGTAVRLRQQREAEAAATRRAKEVANLTKKQVAATKALTAEQKKQNSLKKSATVFDMDQIQAIAALKGQLSDEDRKRVQAQLALLNENDALAQKLTREILMAQDATGGLYRYFLSIGDAKIKNPFAFLDEWLVEFQSKLNNLKFPSMPTAVSAAVAPTSGVVVGFTPTPMNPIPTAGPIQGPQIPSTNASAYSGTIPTGNFTYGQGNPLNTNVYVTVQGSVTTEEDLVSKIASGLQQKSLSTGDSSYINRRTGGFAG